MHVHISRLTAARVLLMYTMVGWNFVSTHTVTQADTVHTGSLARVPAFVNTERCVNFRIDETILGQPKVTRSYAHA